MAKILKENNTKYKIIISPLYNQIPLSNGRKEILFNIFKEENIYDFSGENCYTKFIYNYYETSHYRKFIGDKILDKVYNN